VLERVQEKGNPACTCAQNERIEFSERSRIGAPWRAIAARVSEFKRDFKRGGENKEDGFS